MFQDIIFDQRVYGWQEKAECAKPGVPDIFFPAVNESTGNNASLTSAVNEAKRLCDACPVRRECSLMSIGERYGIWAGVGYKPRQEWKRQVLGAGYDADGARAWAAVEMKKADGDINKVIENNPLLTVIPGMVQDA